MLVDSNDLSSNGNGNTTLEIGPNAFSAGVDVMKGVNGSAGTVFEAKKVNLEYCDGVWDGTLSTEGAQPMGWLGMYPEQEEFKFGGTDDDDEDEEYYEEVQKRGQGVKGAVKDAVRWFGTWWPR